MVTVGMYYDVRPGESDRFVAKFRQVIEALQGAGGHRSSILYRQVDAPDSYAILSEWDDAQAFAAFVRSEAFRQVTSWGLEEVLAHPPRHHVYDRSQAVGRPS
jgi:heme-degrading monooxygenase HmoA